MFDDMFTFIDQIVEPVEDDLFHSTVKMVEVYFDLRGKKGMDRTKSLPKDLSGAVKTDVPLDIALSLLRPDELEKLKNYVTSYLAKHGYEME
jgi:hypothetical protein